MTDDVFLFGFVFGGYLTLVQGDEAGAQLTGLKVGVDRHGEEGMVGDA